MCNGAASASLKAVITHSTSSRAKRALQHSARTLRLSGHLEKLSVSGNRVRTAVRFQGPAKLLVKITERVRTCSLHLACSHRGRSASQLAAHGAVSELQWDAAGDVTIHRTPARLKTPGSGSSSGSPSGRFALHIVRSIWLYAHSVDVCLPAESAAGAADAPAMPASRRSSVSSAAGAFALRALLLHPTAA